MQCHQCPKPALYYLEVEGGQLPLCLDCFMKVQYLTERALEANERRINFLSDQYEMVTGLPGMLPRFEQRPPATFVTAGDLVMNNLKIDRSSIGVLNTGQIGSVDTAIGTLHDNGDDAAADAFRDFTEAIVQLVRNWTRRSGTTLSR